MRKYIQVSLIADEVSGITLPVLMSHVMQALHKVFVEIKDSKDTIPLGISFPHYDETRSTLGNSIRIHGEVHDLSEIDLSKATIHLRDYVHVTSPRAIPGLKLKGYVAYSRIRHDHGKEKLIRRSIKRHAINREEAEALYAGYTQDFFPNYPFVLMRSGSTANIYPIYIKRVLLESPGDGRFNTFGINPAAGVENF